MPSAAPAPPPENGSDAAPATPPASQQEAAAADLVQQQEQRAQLRLAAGPLSGGGGAASTAGSGLDDLDRLAALCSTFFQYYEDFAEQLFPALLRATKFDAATTSGDSSDAAPAP